MSKEGQTGRVSLAGGLVQSLNSRAVCSLARGGLATGKQNATLQRTGWEQVIRNQQFGLAELIGHCVGCWRVAWASAEDVEVW